MLKQIFTHKYWNGNVPSRNSLDDYDKKVVTKLADFPNKISRSIEKFKRLIDEIDRGLAPATSRGLWKGTAPAGCKAFGPNESTNAYKL